MAYARRSLKRKTTKKRSSMKRKAPKARKTSRGTSSKSASHRQTGYYKAVTDPINGPLVGVPQFVPIETHRVRARAIGTIDTSTGEARIVFNPCRMVANDSGPLSIWTNQAGNAITQSDAKVTPDIQSNVDYDRFAFQATAWGAPSTINNGDGIKARVVGAMLRVCNVSAVQTRGGVFTALHEPHHKTVETFTRSELASNTKSIIKPAGDGSYVSLLYRPVKPEEVEDWQISPFTTPGHIHATTTSTAGDGTALDSWPGYMVVDFKGEQNTSLHIEAYAIIEYAGESLTTLSRPIHLGGGKKAEPKDMPAIGTDLKKLEGGGDSLMPDRPGIHGKDRPGTSLVVPKPKKPTPDNNMDVPEDDPWVTPKKTTGRGRVALQVNRKLTAKEWQTIARSMNDRRRPYAPRPVGRAVRRGRASGSMGARVGGRASGYRRRRRPNEPQYNLNRWRR